MYWAMESEHGMDELARATGGLMTEATTPEALPPFKRILTRAPSGERGASSRKSHRIAWWIQQRPRSPEAIAMYRRILRELGTDRGVPP